MGVALISGIHDSRFRASRAVGLHGLYIVLVVQFAVVFSSDWLEWQLCVDEFRMLSFSVRAFLCFLLCFP